MRFLALVFGRWVYYVNSFIIKSILQIRGMKIGKGFYIEEAPNIMTGMNYKNVHIGNNVKIMGTIDIKTRENGKIVIKDGCKIDREVRIVVANDAVFSMGPQTNIAKGTVINCGEDINIGKECLISGYIFLQSSNHGISKGDYIKEQQHIYGKIVIEDGVWIGGLCAILPGVTIKEGAVIGANSVVNNDIPANAIAVGAPAKVVKYRE